MNRGSGASAWATYSTTIGAPVVSTTGGSFRFTCPSTVASCTVSVQAAVLGTQAPTTIGFYPRLLIYKQSMASAGPETYCEYGDGSTGSNQKTLTKQAASASPTYTATPINIGGSDDCGLNGAAGDVNQITVPGGNYYDVNASFLFVG